MAVPTKIISTSQSFQDAKGNVVANGFLMLQLSQNCEVTAGGGQVTTQAIWLPLDVNGKITNTAIWFNDELSPSGTVYYAKLFGSNGMLMIQDLGGWSISGASADLSTVVPTAPSVGAPGVVLLNPVLTQTVTQPNGTALAVSGLEKVSRGSSTSPYILQVLDSAGINNQVIAFAIEQWVNPTSNASYLNFGQVTELLIPLVNSKTFTGQQVGTYGTFSHFGSGALTTAFGGAFEGFNPGPATATVIGGVSATANNGGVATGTPFTIQTPTNNGVATNLRAFDGTAKNLSSGTVTEATVFYAEAPINSGGGTITNAYGLHVADMTAATNNFAILTGQGKVSFGDTATFNKIVGLGIAPDSARGLFVVPTSTTGLAGTTQVGIQSAPATSSAATVEGSGLWARADTSVAAYTQTLNTGVHINTPTVGAGSTITEWNGLRIDASPTAGTKWAIKATGGESSTGVNLIAANATNNVTKANTQNNLSPVTGNSADQVFFTYTIPANTVPTGGAVKITAIWKHSTGTANITYKASLGGVATSNYGALVDAASSTYSLVTIFYNIGTTVAKSDVQLLSNAGAAIASGVSYATGLAVNLTSNQTYNLTFNVANTDAVTPELLIVEIVQ